MDSLLLIPLNMSLVSVLYRRKPWIVVFVPSMVNSLFCFKVLIVLSKYFFTAPLISFLWLDKANFVPEILCLMEVELKMNIMSWLFERSQKRVK